MDPMSVASMAGSCLTLVTRTVKDVNDLVGKLRNMEQKLSLITARLSTIKATISHLEIWLHDDGAASVHEIENDLRNALAACSIVVTEIQLYVTNVGKGRLKGKIRYLWDEAQFLQFSTALDSQIAALGLFVSVILLNSNAQRRIVLDSAASRHALQEACDQASLYTNRRGSLSLRASSSRAQPSTMDAPRAEGSPFTFDNELIDSEAYRAAFRRVMRIGTRNGSEVVGMDTRDVASEAPSSATASILSDRSSSVFTRATGSTNSTTSTSSTYSISERSPNADWKTLSRYSSWSSWSSKQSRTTSKEMCLAAASGDSSSIERLCKKGGDANGRYEIRDSPIVQAGGETGASIKFTLQRGSSSRSDRTPLHYAAEHGHADAIRILIACGADPCTKAKGGRTPLHVVGGGMEAVEALIALGANITAKDDTGATPLHTLATANQTDGVKALLTASCPVNSVDKAQRTPLHLACGLRNNVDVVSALLSAGAYADAPDAEGIRPLHVACEHGNTELIPLLISAGADIEAPAKDLWCPLHYAAAHSPSSASQSSSLVSTLLSLSANHAACTTQGEQPLHLAAAAANVSGVSALLSARAAVDAQTTDGKLPLRMALRPQQPVTPSTTRIVRMLLEHGADPTAAGPSKNAEPPLVTACGALLMAAAKGGGGLAALPLIETLLEFDAAGERREVAGCALLAVCEGRSSSSTNHNNHKGDGDNGRKGSMGSSTGNAAQGGALLDIVRLLVGPRGGARPTNEVFRALWRNGRVVLWEKRAVHAVLNEVADPGLRRDEAEWLIVAL